MTREAPQALRILIIDDNQDDRIEAKAALLNGSYRRYQFIEASSASDGLALCAQAPWPDCILLDLGLPDADDLGVLERMPRDDDGLLRVPVVVLTGTTEHGRNQAALRAGAQDYVGKAWLRPEILTKAVENAIERLGLMQELNAQRRAAAADRASAHRLADENRRVLEANRLKSLFLANMSHELRTPLTAIIGFSDLLLSGTVAAQSPQQERFQGYIGTSGRQLLRLINDLLDLSKVEAGKLTFFPEPLSLSAIVEEVHDVLGAETRRKRIQCTTDVDPLLDDLVLDPARLKQVLFNYLSNAVKFTPDGGRVALRATATGDGQFRIEVEDSGIGIAARDVPRLFTEFQQLDKGNAKHYAGAGLGLALTRHLVEAQGGSVGLRSELGRGSVFWAVLYRVHAGDGVQVNRSAPDGHAPGLP